MIVARNIVTNRRKLVVSSWRSLGSLTIDATTTAPTKSSTVIEDASYWRRIGDTLEFRGSYVHTSNTGAASGSGTYLFPLPLGLNADSSKMPVGTTLASSIAGWAVAKAQNSNNREPGTGIVWMWDSRNLAMAIKVPRNGTNALENVTATVTDIDNQQTMYHIHAWVPIAEWGHKNI